MKKAEELVQAGQAEECPSCGAISAHCWDDVNEIEGVYHIPSADAFGWQCGKCRSYWVDRDSPTLAEVYTHVDPAYLELE